MGESRTLIGVMMIMVLLLSTTVPFAAPLAGADDGAGEPEENTPCELGGLETWARQMEKIESEAEAGGLEAVTPGYIVSEDVADICRTEPLEKATPLAAGWQNIMTEDFEGTFPSGLWATLDNDGVTNGEFYWDDDDFKPHWGSRSAWCANGGADGLDPQFYYYPNNMDAWMVYGPFSLADATDAELNFCRWSDTQFGHDYLWWLASIDGTHFYGWSITGTSSGWVGETFNLTDVAPLGNLCGQSQVWIAFEFTSDNETVLHDGAFIDDIVLRKYVAGVLPHIDSLSLNEGPVDARVVISGSGFGPAQGASTVTFGAVNADISSWSDAQIVVWVPEGAGSSVAVHTTQGDSNAVSFTITDSPVDYWAVIVGVADYPGMEDDLSYTDDDACDVRDALLAGPNWEEGHITMLLDSDATKANIHNAITQMGNNGDGNDLFFFHYSGHGGNDADQPPIDETDGLDEYLAQYDFATDYIWDDEFAEWLAALPGRKVAVSLDACYSGGQVKVTTMGAVRCVAAVGGPVRGDDFLRDINDIIGGVALAASAENETSWEFEVLQNGLYTYYLVEGLGELADSNADDQISMEEAFNYLDPLVSGYSVSEPQTPQMYDGYPGELVILLSEPNNPPNTPSAPSPANHASNVSMDFDLGWTGGDPDAGDTVTYDVYFGTTSSPPPVSSNQGGTSYDPGTLNYSTTYYWKIVARDSHGVMTEGSVWNFTTEGIGVVMVSVVPANYTAVVNEIFTVDIKLSGADPVRWASAYIDFDNAYLEVQGITPGPALNTVVENHYDNVAGAINYSAGKFSGTLPTGTFTLATIEFKALAETSTPTPLTFMFVAPNRVTDVVTTGSVSVLGAVTNGEISIIPITTPTVSGQVAFQGRPAAPHASWVNPLTVVVCEQGTSTVVGTYAVTTNSTGGFSFAFGQALGSYDIGVKGSHTLSRLEEDVVIDGATTNVNFGTLLEGDSDNDDVVDIYDFGILADAFGSVPASANWDERADLNNDDVISINDFGLLADNFGLLGEMN